MATVEKIRRDIEKTREKISEQQKRLRALEAQLTEEENLEIVRMVKAVKMDNRELTAFLKAYASGLITLPDGMMEAEAAAAQAAEAAGYHDIYKKEMLSLSQLEKMMGKKDFNSILGEYVVKPPGKLTLVEDSDPREAVDPSGTAEDEFSKI